MRRTRKKVPFVMQMEALECGAASLSMILAYHGKWLTLPELRETVGVSRDGVNALSIVAAARNYGLEAKGFRWKAPTLRQKLEQGEAGLPCILFWQRNHFVVLVGTSRRGARINDPAAGPVFVSWDEFEKSYSEVALQFAPTEAFKPSGRRTSVLGFAKKRLSGAKPTLAFLTLAGVAATGLSIIQPALSSSFVDKVLSGSNPSWLEGLLLALAGLTVIQTLLLAANASYQLRAQGRLAVAADYGYVNHVLRLPLGFFSQRMAGDIYSRQKANASIAQTLMATLAPIGVGVLAMAVYLAAMLAISPALTLIGASALLLDVLVAQAVSKKRVRLSRSVARDGGNLNGSTSAIFNVIESIKASGAENGVFAQWAGLQSSLLSGQAAVSKLGVFWGSVPQLVMDLANAALLALGALLIMQGQMTSGLFLAFQSLMQSFVKPAQQLISVSQKFIEMRTDMERIEDVTNHELDPVFTCKRLDATPKTEAGTARETRGNAFAGEGASIGAGTGSTIESEVKRESAENLTGRASMRNVTFGYSPLADPLLKGFSLELAPGRSVALVGPSGCGKSTVAKLLAGLYQPWSGEVLFDGLPAEAYDRKDLTKAVGLVDQDVFLFSGTVKDNFRFADDDVAEASMVQAAQDACAHEAILKHAGGYDGRIVEGGRNFSGGQRQQLEIARVLAGGPRLIILDEATSALDARTEARVMEAVKARGVALLIVAHRLSTVRDADEIIVLDRGNAMERGTHDELMALNGAYAKLVATG